VALRSPSTEQLRSISLDCLSQNGRTGRGFCWAWRMSPTKECGQCRILNLYLNLKTMWGSDVYFGCYDYVCELYEVWRFLLVVMSSWATVSVWSSLHTAWVRVSLWCSVVELWGEWGIKVTCSRFIIPLIFFFDTIYSGLHCIVLLKKLFLLGLEDKRVPGNNRNNIILYALTFSRTK